MVVECAAARRRRLAARTLSNQLSHVPLPKNVEFVTFDCYGTLIDWETGAYDAFQKEADRDGFTIDRDELIPRFIEIQREIQQRLLRALRRGAAPHGGARARRSWAGTSSPRARASCPTACPSGRPSARPTRSSSASPRSSRPAILSNIDDKLLGATRRHFRADFDLVVTAQQVRSYKPDPAHFKECARRIEGKKKRWVHIASRLPDRRRALPQAEGPRDLGQPPRRAARDGPEEADRGGQDLPRRGEAARRRLGSGARCGPSRSTATRWCVTSRMWQTNAIALRAGGEAMLIDSPYFPDELELLPALLEQAGFEPDGAARHARRLRPPARPARLPGPAAGRGGADACCACAREPGRRPARAARPRRRVLRGAARAARARARCRRCRCPGKLELGEEELELHPGRGAHRRRHWPCSRRWAGVLVVRRLPLRRRDPDDLAGRLARGLPLTLERLAPLVERAASVVPGPRLAACPRRGAARSSTRTWPISAN